MRVAWLALALAIPLLSGCQNNGGMTNQQAGGVAGAGAGGLLGGLFGNQMGHSGTSTAVGAGLGAIAGYFIGSSIGARLDETDRKKAETSTSEVLHSTAKTKKAAWTSDKNKSVHGSSQVVKVDPKPDGGECKTVREVAYIKGEEVTQNSRYCRTAGGEWTAAT
jgi:surface antigen